MEIAKRLAASVDEEQLIFERVRHWTREGLVSPAGNSHPGIGRKRLYDESSLPKARMLNSLTKCGVTIKTLSFVSQFIDNGILDREKLLFGETVYLLIQKLRGVEDLHISLYHLPKGADVAEPKIGLNSEEARDSVPSL